MEFLITFPLLFAAFLMVIHYGLLMKTKLSLTNATHAAAQAYAKTQNCGKAIEYFYANFDQLSGASIICSSPGGENSEVSVQYVYPAENLILLTIPSQKLTAKSVAMTEKEE